VTASGRPLKATETGEQGEDGQPDAGTGGEALSGPERYRSCEHAFCACRIGAVPQCRARYSNPGPLIPEATRPAFWAALRRYEDEP
jgi:hypothetical protein